MTDAPADPADESALAAAKITQRIGKVELARQHAQAGRKELALELLRGVLDSYEDEKKRNMVAFLIQRLESGAEI